MATRGLIDPEFEKQSLVDPEVNKAGMVDQEWPQTVSGAASTQVPYQPWYQVAPILAQ